MGQFNSRKFWGVFLYPLLLIAVLWMIHYWQVSEQVDWSRFGVKPRTSTGLRGILFSPLLHGSWEHLFSNTIPLFSVSLLLWSLWPGVAWRALSLIWIITGFGVWAFARGETWHIGASGVVYGLVALLTWIGIVKKDYRTTALSLLMLVVFQGMFPGIIPTQEGISWESHLIGALAGIFTAYFFRDDFALPPLKITEGIPESEKTYFFARDVFEKTLEQREWERQQEILQRLQEEEIRRLLEEQRRQNPYLGGGWYSSRT